VSATVGTTTKQRQPRRHVGILSLLVLLLGGAAGGWWWWTNQAATVNVTTSDAPITTTLTLTPYTMTVVGAGTLEAGRTLGLVSETRGELMWMAPIGTRVATGDVVARLDDEPFQDEVEDAEAALVKARSNLVATSANLEDAAANRALALTNATQAVATAERRVTDAEETLALRERLFAIGDETIANVEAARNELDDARRSLDDAVASLDRDEASHVLQATSDAETLASLERDVSEAERALVEARDNLAAAEITAPFAGVVSTHAKEVGAIVGSDATIATIIDDTTLDLPVQIDETEIAQVQACQSATLLLDALPDLRMVGSVDAVSPVGRLESNIPVFEVTVRIDNPDGTLRPGMTAEAEIVTAEYEATASVPLDALVTPQRRDVGTERVLQRVVSEEETERVVVTLIDSLGYQAIVVGDLEEGDVVLGGTASSTASSAATDVRDEGSRRPEGGLPGGGIPGSGIGRMP